MGKAPALSPSCVQSLENSRRIAVGSYKASFSLHLCPVASRNSECCQPPPVPALMPLNWKLLGSSEAISQMSKGQPVPGSASCLPQTYLLTPTFQHPRRDVLEFNPFSEGETEAQRG